MKRSIITLTLSLGILCTATAGAQDSPANIRLTDVSLMHESRATPYPADGWVETERAVSFQWPMPDWARGRAEAFDGMASKSKGGDKSTLRYRIRYSQDKTFPAASTVSAETLWPFYNPDPALTPGTWYWQHALVNPDGTEEWSPVYTVTVEGKPAFCPPLYAEFRSKLPASHPRILVDSARWDEFIAAAKTKPEYKWYIKVADKTLAEPMPSVDDIRTDKVASFKSEHQVTAYLTRESRRVIDKVEKLNDALIRAYVLTKDRRYADEAVRRVLAMGDWDKHPNVRGDFNNSAILNNASLAYDSFYNILTPEQRTALLKIIEDKAGRMYRHDMNHLENHIADNHVWQMTMRIAALASYAVLGDLPAADTWADYYYNVWLARFPGLNRDGAWHNGDSYFTVNTRTLVEVPWFYTRVTGYDFFSDPWYRGNVLYTMYQQPPFSKSGGNGSSHRNVVQPNAVRIGYLDAMARLLGDTYAADFVRRTLEKEPGYLKKAHLSKPGDLAWFRLQCDRPLPTGTGIAALPHGHTFPQSGLSSAVTNWSQPRSGAMWSFRSSPYGSTSHALANQNAFNTFYGGLPLFYSSGHHTSFVDRHAALCHRGTRAHNTILPDGMMQRLGVEGYGWIPRHYNGPGINYVLGDASNAYGKVISPLWLERGETAGIEYTPENGWDETHVKTFRRHIVDLGSTGWILVYDELEADKPVEWQYLLHSIAGPVDFAKAKDHVHVSTVNKTAAGDAYLYSTGALACDTTSRFFVPADNWLKGDANGKFKKNPDDHHFTARTAPAPVYRFAALVNSHAAADASSAPKRLKDGSFRAAGWTVTANLSADGRPAFSAVSPDGNVSIRYDGEETTVTEDGHTTVLRDQVPDLEI